MNKIKVLHIIKSLGRGGAEMLLPQTLKLHDKSQFEFHYIYFLPWKDQLVEMLKENGGSVTCLEASNNIQILLAYKKIIRYVKQHNITIIHAHLPWAGFVSRIVFRFLHIPVLYSEHNKQERYHWLTFWINKFTFNWQTLAIAVSGDVATSIKENIRPRVPVETILNGVNDELFSRNKFDRNFLKTELKLPDNSIVIGAIGVFRFQKRFDLWLEVLAKLTEKHANVYGVIVGDGPLKSLIVETRARLGLQEKVFMVGLQTEVRPWLAGMDIYLMTSIFEGLPIALLEAMSMECPVVTTDAGGIKEVIRHEVDGLSVPVEKWEQLAAEADRLIQDTTLRDKLAQAAALRVRSAFSISRMVSALEDTYRRCKNV